MKGIWQVFYRNAKVERMAYESELEGRKEMTRLRLDPCLYTLRYLTQAALRKASRFDSCSYV
jgi:hypothetical protein